MKRKKTRPPRADTLLEITEKVNTLSSGGATAYRAAEAARLVYEEAQRLHWRFPQDAETSTVFAETQRRYWQLIEEAFPVTFRPDQARLMQGDVSGIESIVAFLEADPIFYGTGYLKEDLSRALNRVELPSSYFPRVQAAILHIVDHRDGREFRAYCRLACKVDRDELREQLTQRLGSGDADIRRRAQWVLEALAQKDCMGQGRENTAARKTPRVETRGAE